MIDNKNIKLNYFTTFRIDTQWFILYEFKISDKELFHKTDSEIISKLLKTRILNEKIYHKEMDNSKIEINRESIKMILERPFIFEKLVLKDFNFIRDIKEFKSWLIKFRTDDWEDDREDAQRLIDQAEREISERTKLQNGIWWLSKQKIENQKEKMTELHWIYHHFETFIEIDRKNKLVRTFDFGYD
ncbi:hypothetical protein SAMN05444411_1312 [Lutibacter oricola]|uniref:Uncharacterized protein n=1 Tax=Lutibacter oricola TaxID=762486 RepID=A0A1H3HAH6_9FLAO|nr:hypothetical protein [Lutibacter oricola]SDY12417.1 hypothetical protein SAMN05444411_1312 [Lutibacter oricola]